MSLWKAVLSSAVYVPASCSLSNLKTLAWDLCPGTWCMSAYSSTFVLQTTAAPLSFSTPCARCSSWPMPLVWLQLCSACGLGKQLEAAVLLGGREFILLTGLPTREVAFPWASSPWPCPGQKPCSWSGITLWHTGLKKILPSAQINAAKEVLRREKRHIPNVLITSGWLPLIQKL